MNNPKYGWPCESFSNLIALIQGYSESIGTFITWWNGVKPWVMTRVMHAFLNSVKGICAIMWKLQQLNSFEFWIIWSLFVQSLPGGTGRKSHRGTLGSTLIHQVMNILIDLEISSWNNPELKLLSCRSFHMIAHIPLTEFLKAWITLVISYDISVSNSVQR